MALAGPTAATASQRRFDTRFASAAIAGQLHFQVYLPAGYDSEARRYPVLYVLHGLPSAASAYTSLEFVERALDTVGQPAILVVPQGARTGESDPEYVDHGPGDEWATAIATELPRIVDARFRTIRSRAGRALIGISAGGYGAMQLGLHHLGEFSVIESWSGYFHATDPTGSKPLDLGSAARNSQADVHQALPAVRKELLARRTFVAFYVGRGDRLFYAENELLNQQLSEDGVAHVFRAYPGGHDEALWQRYAAAWLGLALVHLASAH